jgi:hypothetical protein
MTSTNFWSRFGLGEDDREICLCAVRARYEGCAVEEIAEQGYCSCTLLITPSNDIDSTTTSYAFTDIEANGVKGQDGFIVQLRPAPHALDLDIVRTASTTYSALAPVIRALDLVLPGRIHAYGMQKLPGTLLSRLLPRERTLNPWTYAKLERLITSFARMNAQGWQSSPKLTPTMRASRAGPSMYSTPNMLSKCPSKVGSTIVHRLEKLAAELPDADLRERADETLRAVQRMTDYPVVLNHGDLIPSNILIDMKTWEITGLVDWAEAEYLPFGTCFYGLEHVLGYLTSPSADITLTFVYFNDAARLRELFWMRLFDAVPELHDREKEVKAMRDLGVLLWHGIAWDDGAINRVVKERDDAEELAKLRAFLNAS